MLVRNDAGALRHVEFQASNEAEFPFRMLRYWVYFREKHERPVKQCVFYLGSEPMRLPSFFEENGTRHEYEVVNLHDYQASELLASDDWGDNLWALGAQGDSPIVLREILEKLSRFSGDRRSPARIQHAQSARCQPSHNEPAPHPRPSSPKLPFRHLRCAGNPRTRSNPRRAPPSPSHWHFCCQ